MLGTPKYNETTCGCDPDFRYYLSGRQIANSPLSSDIVKCTLKPLGAAEYMDQPPPAQIARMRAVFKFGVCDWANPALTKSRLGRTEADSRRAVSCPPVQQSKRIPQN